MQVFVLPCLTQNMQPYWNKHKIIRFLETQIKHLENERKLNSIRDEQQLSEILHSFSQYNTHGVIYKDTRIDTSPPSYHEIDYYQIFKETL